MELNNGLNGKGFNFIKLNSQANNVNAAKQEPIQEQAALVQKQEVVEKQPILSSLDIREAIKKVVDSEIIKAPEEAEKIDLKVSNAVDALKEQSLLKYSKEEDIKGFLVRVYRPEDKINLVG